MLKKSGCSSLRVQEAQKEADCRAVQVHKPAREAAGGRARLAVWPPSPCAHLASDGGLPILHSVPPRLE